MTSAPTLEQLQTIPQTIRDIPNWFAWRWEMRDGKETKVPYIPGTNRRASVSDPSTWSPFDAARAKMNGQDDGLGFVTTEAIRIILTDLDDCIRDGKLDPWAQRIITLLASYTEISPSGTGAHIVCAGTMPADGHRFGSCEMYRAKHYFTMSGLHLEGAPLTVEERDVSWLFRLLTARTFVFTTDEKYRRLFVDGDWQGLGYPSQSEGDLALISMLFARGLTEADVLNAFALSPLSDRQKWARTDYRRRTLDEAQKTKSGPVTMTTATAMNAPPATASVSGLICTKDGTPLRILSNCTYALRNAPEWRDVLAFDEFSCEAIARKATPWGKIGVLSDSDALRFTEWCHHVGIFISSKVAGEALEIVASESGFHPVRTYFDGLVWDGQPRLLNWLTTYAGAESSEYCRAVANKWMISVAARVYRPGCRADGVLTAEGDQGALKSTMLASLVPDPRWFCDTLPDLDSKDAREQLRDVLIVELAELNRIRGHAREKVKAFLSCCADRYRPSYGRRAQTFPRQNVFCASTNDSDFLDDPTGARRWWPVQVGHINIEALICDRDALWAEAVHMYRQNSPWWFESRALEVLAEAEQEKRYTPHPWDPLLEEWAWGFPINVPLPQRRLRQRTGVRELPWLGSVPGKVTATDALVHAIGIDPDRIKPTDAMVVGRCLRHLNWAVKQETSGPNRGRRFYSPRALDGGLKAGAVVKP